MGDLRHSNWLPVRQEQDAVDFKSATDDTKFDWLVVDHYALDHRWHNSVKESYSKLLAIDDPRKVAANLLLDQNLMRAPEHYRGLIGKTIALLGVKYALLRSEFHDARSKSFAHRKNFSLKNILVNFGGADEQNLTLHVLKKLRKLTEYSDISFEVIVGPAYRHLESLNDFLQRHKLSVKLHVATKNMAEIMTGCDLCIGAAGASALERIALGIPTLIFTLADNQKNIALALQQNKLAQITNLSNFDVKFYDYFDTLNSPYYQEFLEQCREICDGLGARRVVDVMEEML